MRCGIDDFARRGLKTPQTQDFWVFILSPGTSTRSATWDLDSPRVKVPCAASRGPMWRCESRSLGTNLKPKKIEFWAFLGPSGQNQLYHTPLLFKIWDLTKNRKIVNDPFKPPPVPSLRVHLCGSQRGLSRTYWRPCSSGCWPTPSAGQSRVICESLIAARLQFWSSHCYLFSINSWEHYHLWKKLCCLMMFKSRKYANCSNFKIKTTPNNTQIGVYPEYYWNTEKATFKHKKISSSTFAFICQNNQIPSCDEN